MIDKQCRIRNEYFVLQSLSSHDDVTTWLTLTLEIKKLEAEQACLQDEVQKLKNVIQDNSLLNLDIARLTADIETVDAQNVSFSVFYVLSIN